MTLSIAQQSQQSWTGSCALQGSQGTSNFPVTDGTVDHSGNITFSINATDSNGNNVTVAFMGTQQGTTGWTGTYSVTNSSSGSWSVS